MGDVLRKIILVGPVYPYKGGIAHYTGLMYRALAKRYETVVVSYKLQYPKFLIRRGQKDYGNDRFKIQNTRFWINTINPFNYIYSALKMLNENADLVVIQWWHPYFAPCYWTIGRIIRRKTKLVYVCHNVFPHERFPMDQWLTKLVLKNADGYIVQSEQDKQELLKIKPNALYSHTVLPSYNTFRMRGLNKHEARMLFGIPEDQKVLLFFGFVREYKGLKYLLQAMPQIMEKFPDILLFIVGDFDGGSECYLKQIKEMNIVKNVYVIDEYLPDQEIEKYFAASDLVVLPYISATQSAVVQVAYGFEKPVIVTNVGGLPEAVENGKTGYVVPARDPVALADAICRFFLENNEKLFIQNIRSESYRYSWKYMVKTIEELYENMKESF